MKYAVIDVGSNSVRLLLTDDPNKVTQKQLVSTMLAKGLHGSGMLDSESIERTARAVADFAVRARAYNADKIYIFATEAVRAAKNGAQFTDRVYALTNLKADVISGASEAQIGYLGASGGEDATVVDIGGASVEIINGKGGEILYDKSLPLGLVRLLDSLPDEPIRLKEVLKPRLAAYGDIPHCNRIVGIGGTATSLAAMNLNLKDYNPLKVHGAVITREMLENLQDKIYMSRDRNRDFPLLGENRARLIGYGAVLLGMILDYLRASEISVSELDNAEGYILKKTCIK